MTGRNDVDMSKIIRTVAAIGAISVAAAFSTHSANAQSMEETYEGQTLTILIGHPPGGSYDLYAQLAAEFMGEHIPGNPNIIVQHQPGGGGRRAAATFINNTDPDGLMVAVLPDSLGHIQFLRPDAASWDASAFRYIGRFATANVAFAVRADKATNAEEMRDQEIIVACTGRNARSAQQAAAMMNVAGLNLRMICGYDGSQATVLAALRGEADMLSQNYASFVSDPNDLGDGTLNIVVQTGLERHPDMADVPLMQELTDDPDAQAVLRFLGASAPIGRSMMIHPDSPEYIIEGLQTAFDAMLADPDFLAAAEQRSAIIEHATGDQMNAIMIEIMGASEELITNVLAAIDTSSAQEVQ
jgi:tripartite-type tricarboxylate transporter receptor subunit TctC